MSEIAELIAALRAWGPLVSSGHEVPAAGGVMHRAADQLESYQRVAVASGTIMQDQVQALAVAERNATEAAASLTRQTERVAALEKALKDATAHLAAATSVYQRFCRKGVTGDALYTTRLKDFEAAIRRAHSTLKESQAPTK